MNQPPQVELAPGRQCGGCKTCCEVFNIDELNKPAGDMCVHAVNAGCGIYEARPGACRAFFCLWRRIGELPDEARPDRLGVMFWTSNQPNPRNLFERLFVVGSPTGDPRALEQDLVRQIVERFAQSDLPVYLAFGGRYHLVHPNADLADAIVNPHATPHRHLLPQAHAWLARFLPHLQRYEAARLPPRT